MFFWEGGRLVIGLSVDCKTEDAWQVLTDTRLWPEWGPSVKLVDCRQRRIGPGSAGKIKTSLGIWVPFTITEYRDQKFWAWRIGRFRATGHRLEKSDENCCTIAFDMPWWAAPYLAVCLVALRRIRRLVEAGEGAAFQPDN